MDYGKGISHQHTQNTSFMSSSQLHSENKLIFLFFFFLVAASSCKCLFCKYSFQVDSILLIWNAGDFLYLVLSLLVHSFHITKIVKTCVQIKQFLQLWKCHGRLYHYNKTEKNHNYGYYNVLVQKFHLKVVSVLFSKFYTTGYAK